MNSARPRWRRTLSPGIWIIFTVAVLSSGLIALLPGPQREGTQLWTFLATSVKHYQPAFDAWNRQHPDDPVTIRLLEYSALQRRMLSGFFAGTPTADLLEIERNIASRAFVGPIDRTGFVDLTDRIRADGLLDEIPAAGFSPWSSRGRIFGLPVGVHPVLLCYRADLVEAAGLDVAQIETWDDYFRVLRPLMADRDGDGRPDRYLISGWNTNAGFLDMLMLQAGAKLFDDRGRPTLATPRNAEILARLVHWFAGPDRVAADAPDFSPAGNRQRVEGYVVGTLMPDWLAGAWKADLPALAGKVKLMPVPAWEPGGCRTSAWGGTMIGIARTAPRVDEKWQLIKSLYYSRELAELNFHDALIVSPLRSFRDLPVYQEPEPYFCGQQVGRLFIAQFPSMPSRPSSPFFPEAHIYVVNVLTALKQYAESIGRYDAAALEPKARELLGVAQASFARQMARNPFLAPP
jgi:arabinosaccharide transport system substrate-binding protein